MISHIEGVVLAKHKEALIIDVSGVGYSVHVSDNVLLKKNVEDTVRLWTHLAVRENAMDLYGFSTRQELSFFELLIGVSGIGPKSALAICSLAPIETLASAVASGDTSYLTKVSGVGRKSAEKIVLELRDKLGGSEDITKETRKADIDALSALQSLGYSMREAREALKEVDDSVEDMGDRVKEALKNLSTHHD